MVRYIFTFLFIIVFSADASIFSEWKYSKASDAITNGDYTQAQDLMRTMLVDEPTRPDLLYDLGITSFKNKEYEQAAAYFNSAATAEPCPPQLAEQALFNLGNACVELKQLNDAIVHYQKVLEMNEKNEFARHNLEVVKKMREEQEKQQQNQDDQKDQDQNKDDKQDQQDQQKNKDQNQSGDKDKNKDDSSKGDDGNEDEKDSQDKKENDKSGKSGQDKKDQKDNGKNDQNKPDDSKDKQDNKNKDDKGKDNQKDKKQKDKSSEQQKLEQKVKDDAQKSVDAEGDKGNEKKDKKGNSSAPSGMPQDKDLDLAPEDKWILQVLDRRENDEKKTNKELMRATIDKKLAGQDGKNCW